MKSYFSDSEYRILLSALTREEKVCKNMDGKVTDNANKEMLVPIINSIIRKVYKLQHQPVVQNVRESSLKKCIILDSNEFEAALRKAFGNSIIVNYDMEGMWYEDEADSDIEITADTIYKKLSDYFGIKITSIHMDDCEVTGIWIVYKENN